MRPEPTNARFDDIETRLAYLEHMQSNYAAMKAYMDKEKPGWDTRIHATPAAPAEDGPDYLWHDRPVTFVSSVESDGVRMAWVTMESGHEVLAPLSELKPIKDER